MPSSPYPISGIVYDSDGSTALSGAIVGAKNVITNDFLAASAMSITNALGQYTIDLANLPEGYTDKDFVQVLVFKPSGNYFIYDTYVNATAGSESKNLTSKKFTYASPSKISDFLMLERGFNLTSNPSACKVCDCIARAEEYIDTETQRAWREKTSTQEFHNFDLDYHQGTGVPVFLNFRNVKAFDTDKGDKLEIWDGSNWKDYITDYTEGRGQDFWVDYTDGIVWVMTSIVVRTTRMKVRVTYRYGSSAVDADIENCAVKLAAIDILTNEDRSLLIPSGEVAGTRYDEKARIWKEEVDRVLAQKSSTGIGSF